jgi:transcription antitermination factor NusG
MKDRVDFWQKTNWFAIETKAYREDLAAKRVGKLGLEVFLPRIREERSVCGVVRSVTKALFPGYFFSRFCPFVSLDTVRHSHGVSRVVGSERYPIPVGDEVVRDIQERVEEDGLVKVNPPALEPGIRVSIRNGPFEGLVGTVLREADDRKRVAILLEMLLGARVLIERRWIEADAEAG